MTVSRAPKTTAAGRATHLSLDERTARGKAARADVPRRVHAQWEAAPGRRDPIEMLEEQATSVWPI